MMAEFQALKRAECLQLLASHSFGRLAVSVGEGAPTIRPINYLFDEPSQSIVFRTAYGSKLQGLLTSAKAAFEIDGIDPEQHTGWSVIVVGATEEIVNPFDLRRLEGSELETWAPGPKPHWIGLRVWSVSGRRIVNPDHVVDPDNRASMRMG